jgi:hypothetical protein
MTEDDTFEALKRTPLNIMMGYYDEWAMNSGDLNQLQSLCHRNGWSWSDFSYEGALWKENRKKDREGIILKQTSWQHRP